MSSQPRIAGFREPPGEKQMATDSLEVDWTRPKDMAEQDWQLPRTGFEGGGMYEMWRERVRKSDNDFIVVIAASTQSAVSGVGKTTLAIELARYFDESRQGFDAETKATLDPEVFANDLLANEGKIKPGSAIIFDESQGTLASSGMDARRSMANSVMAVTTALSTMRFKQYTSIIVTQSTKWIDKRVDDILDVLVLIQPSRGDTIQASVYDTFYADLENSGAKRYTKRIDTIEWQPLPESDPDYQQLDKLKQQSAHDSIEDDEEESVELPKSVQMDMAQTLRDRGMTPREIANDVEYITYSKSTIYNETETPEEAGQDD